MYQQQVSDNASHTTSPPDMKDLLKSGIMRDNTTDGLIRRTVRESLIVVCKKKADISLC